MTAAAGELVVPRRFRGPATSGNGGWTAGSLAALVTGTGRAAQPPVRVRLSAPPPLDTPLQVDVEAGAGRALLNGRVVLEATTLGEAEAQQALVAVRPVPHATAVEAGERYRGRRDHPFPECFGCGTARPPGDGLRLRPGPVDDGVAAAWWPDPSVADEDGLVSVPVLWAALDCPGGWAVDLIGRPMVLGTMTARIDDRPEKGEPLVVTGRALDVSERKAVTATTLYRSSGEALAVAAHVWVMVDPATFGAGATP